MKVNNASNYMEILDLYFESFKYHNTRILGQTKLELNNLIQYSKVAETSHDITVVITTKITTENSSITLELRTVGKFRIPDDVPEKLRKDIELRNTVAIMLPHIRSEISLLTTQPGMMPIMMPPIDVNQLVDEQLKRQQVN